MKVSQNGIDLIKKYEGLYLDAYLCPANVWTIGYGHTKDVAEGDTITEQQAEDLLVSDLIHSENTINRFVKKPLNQNQFDALVSFVFNIGRGAFAVSTMLKLLNSGLFQEASNQFGRWVFAKGKRLEGLVKRREDERQLFIKEDV